MNKRKFITTYLNVDIYTENGLFRFYIGAFRFAAESLDEAYRIIDRYHDREEDEEE